MPRSTSACVDIGTRRARRRVRSATHRRPRERRTTVSTAATDSPSSCSPRSSRRPRWSCSATSVEIRTSTAPTARRCSRPSRDADALLVRSATQVDAEVVRRRDAAEGRRARRGRPRQRRRPGRHGARRHGRQRADLEHRLRRRARPRAAAGHRPAHPGRRREPARRASGSAARYTGVEINGKTVGIVGLGKIGQLVAQRIAAFGVELIAYDPYLAAGARRPARHRARRARRAAAPRGHDLDPPAEDPGDARAHRQGPAGADQAGRASSSTPPAAGSSTRTRWPRPCAPGTSAAPGSTSTSPSRPRRARCSSSRRSSSPRTWARRPTEAQDRAGTDVARSVQLALRRRVRAGRGERADRRRGRRGGPAVAAADAEAGHRAATRVVGPHAELGHRRRVAASWPTRTSRCCRSPRCAGCSRTSSRTRSRSSTCRPLAEERGVTVELDDRRRRARTTAASCSCARRMRRRRVGHRVRHADRRARGARSSSRSTAGTSTCAPRATSCCFEYADRPGVMGRVGSLLGEAAVNIEAAQIVADHRRRATRSCCCASTGPSRRRCWSRSVRPSARGRRG